MICYKKGDLLMSDCTVIMHQANCFSTMGAGIARAIAVMYPNAESADKRFPGKPEERLGNYSHSNESNGTTVVNLYGQYKYGSGLRTEYDKLESALDSFLSDSKLDDSIDLSSVGVPYKMGCGLAGGDWNEVVKILKRQSVKHNVKIQIYKIQGG